MTDDDARIIHLAADWHPQQGDRERLAREELGLSWVQFWARVNRLLDQPAAALAEPVRIARLRRIRDQRLLQRRAS